MVISSQSLIWWYLKGGSMVLFSRERLLGMQPKSHWLDNGQVHVFISERQYLHWYEVFWIKSKSKPWGLCSKQTISYHYRDTWRYDGTIVLNTLIYIFIMNRSLPWPNMELCFTYCNPNNSLFKQRDHLYLSSNSHTLIYSSIWIICWSCD